MAEWSTPGLTLSASLNEFFKELGGLCVHEFSFFWGIIFHAGQVQGAVGRKDKEFSEQTVAHFGRLLFRGLLLGLVAGGVAAVALLGVGQIQPGKERRLALGLACFLAASLGAVNS